MCMWKYHEIWSVEAEKEGKHTTEIEFLYKMHEKKRRALCAQEDQWVACVRHMYISHIYKHIDVMLSVSV